MDQATNLRRIIKQESGKIQKLKKYKDDRESSKINGPLVIAVTSGKGGVGKTNIVGNLAIAYQRMKKKALIFDADLGLANIDIIYGINPKHTIEEVISGEKELSQIIVKGPENVAIIPASSGVQELAHLSEGHKINLLNEFDILNSKFDILLIDTSAGISSVVAKFMGSISLDYAGFIPYDKHLHDSVSRREPVSCCYPEATSSHSFKKLADYLLIQTMGKSNDGNIKFFFKRLMARKTV